MDNLNCNKAPEGWFCSRGYGHDGPCAAHKVWADAHDELYALAKAATPGPWKYQAVNRIGKNDAFVPEDARYIAAAHPAAVIALIDEVRRLKAERDVWVHNSDQSAECWRNLTAENERMRKALMTIRDGHRCESHKVADDALQTEFMLAHKAALAGERGKA